MEQLVFLLDIPYILSRLELCTLRIHICVENLRHELYEQHDADHSEGISKAVSDGCICRTGSVPSAAASPGVLVRAPDIIPTVMSVGTPAISITPHDGLSAHRWR